MNGNSVYEKSMNKTTRRNDEEDCHNPYSVDVDFTPETQKFISKKLAEALDAMLEEVVMDGVGGEKKTTDDEVGGIYLFSSSGDRISSADIQRIENPLKKQKKPKLKRKRHVDGSDSEDEYAKLRAVAVTSDWVKTSVY